MRLTDMNHDFVTMMQTAGGVKPQVTDKIPILEFFKVLWAPGLLQRNDVTIGMYRLEDYNLDDRFKDFVLPRGIYLDESRLSLNHYEAPEDISSLKDDKGVIQVVSPAEFGTIQTQILGALRKSDNNSLNLYQASESLTLISAASRLMNDSDMCEYNDKPYFPLKVSLKLYKDAKFNYEVKDMVKDLIRDFFVKIRQ